MSILSKSIIATIRFPSFTLNMPAGIFNPSQWFGGSIDNNNNNTTKKTQQCSVPPPQQHHHPLATKPQTSNTTDTPGASLPLIEKPCP
jgi:hypothetical protein